MNVLGFFNIAALMMFQTNGLTERMNASIKMGLRKLRERKGDWPQFLNQVLRGLRWHTPRSTKHSPFELAFSFKPRIHVVEGEGTTDDVEEMMDDFLAGESDAQSTFEERADENSSAQEAKFAEAKANIKKEQEKQKKEYDRKRETTTFHTGDRVLLLNSRKRTRKGEELDSNYTGPYTIKRLTKVNTAYLESDDLTKKMNKAVSITRLKPFNESKGFHKTGSKRPQERVLNFNPPDLQKLKCMARKLKLEEASIRRSPFGPNVEFTSLSKPIPQKVVCIQGDGNCLFRCLSYCVTGSEDYHPALRNAIMDFMRKDDSGIFSTLLGDIEGYISQGVGTPATPGDNGKEHWGTDIEISAFCSLLNCTVMVWKDQDNPSSECWVAYNPLPHPNSRHTRQTDDTDRSTFLLHAPVDHFNVVISP